MITVSIKFPPPFRYGYGTTGKIMKTQCLFPPPPRSIQPFNYCYKAEGCEQTITSAFPKQLHSIAALYHCYCSAGKEHTATAALTKPVHYTQLLRYHYHVEGKEHAATIILPKVLRYRQQLSGHYQSDGHEYNSSVLFQKTLRYVQQLYYNYKNQCNGHAVTLILNPVRILRHGKFLYQYDKKQFNHTKLKFRYDYKSIVGTKLLFTFDRISRIETKLAWKHCVLVRSGWRIMARDIADDEIREIGFIDAENPEHALTNRELPEGDYEIFVLTSSLFWKDCQDQNIRTISVRSDTDISPFPVIYNLRSSISQGTTIIEWSANQIETEDCVFALWYSPETSATLILPPDKTIDYLPYQTEYRTTFQQNEPVYLTLAAMRTGNEPQYDRRHELFMDWNTTVLRAPDDVLVLNQPLSVIDPNIETTKTDEPNITRWF